MEIIASLIGLITLIVFFVMASALSNISRNTKDILKMMKNGTTETIVYTCATCNQDFEGKLPKCPFCGKAQKYS